MEIFLKEKQVWQVVFFSTVPNFSQRNNIGVPQGKQTNLVFGSCS